jgi:MFS family permease
MRKAHKLPKTNIEDCQVITMDAQVQTAPEAAAAFTSLVPDHRRRIAVFLMLLGGMFIATLDNQIVSTALPTIVGEFGALERFGWVGSAYLLATSTVMPLYGKLGDLFGRKYVMMAAIAIFTLGSAACGFAVSMDTLIAARVLQGLGGGGIMVSIFSINADLFEPRVRARYQSYSSLVLMASGAIGPTLGGAMSDYFGWRSIFLVNLPLGALVLIGLGLLLPYRKPHRKPQIDFAGALLLAGAVASVVLWADARQVFGSLVAPQSLAVVAFGLVCLFGWIAVERRVAEPVIPLSLFSSQTVNLLLIISLVSGAVGIGSVNYLALYLQTTTGLTPSVAGLLFIFFTAGIATGSLITGRLISITGRYKIFSIISASGFLIAFISLALLPAHTPLYVIVGLFMLQGLSAGFGQQVPVVGVQNAADPRDVGASTGVVTLTRMAGASIAISVYGAVLGTAIAGTLPVVPGVKDVAELTPAAVAALPFEARQQIMIAYGNAFQSVFVTMAIVISVGLIAALMLKNIRLPTIKGKA